MSLTPSTMLPLGSTAPAFELLDTISSKTKTLAELKSDKATAILFICNHCPYVIHIQTVLVDVAKEYLQKGIQFIAINSNDVDNYPDDSPERMQEIAKEHNYPFPYLFDETQEVAKAYKAACTPDLYLFDADLKCVYRGRFDGATPGNDLPVTGGDLRAAMDAVLGGQPVSKEQHPSMGCNIKWK